MEKKFEKEEMKIMDRGRESAIFGEMENNLIQDALKKIEKIFQKRLLAIVELVEDKMITDIILTEKTAAVFRYGLKAVFNELGLEVNITSFDGRYFISDRQIAIISSRLKENRKEIIIEQFKKNREEQFKMKLPFLFDNPESLLNKGILVIDEFRFRGTTLKSIKKGLIEKGVFPEAIYMFAVASGGNNPKALPFNKFSYLLKQVGIFLRFNNDKLIIEQAGIRFVDKNSIKKYKIIAKCFKKMLIRIAKQIKCSDDCCNKSLNQQFYYIINNALESKTLQDVHLLYRFLMFSKFRVSRDNIESIVAVFTIMEDENMGYNDDCNRSDQRVDFLRQKYKDFLEKVLLDHSLMPELPKGLHLKVVDLGLGDVVFAHPKRFDVNFDYKFIRNLIMSKQGRMLFEKYWNKFPEDILYNFLIQPDVLDSYGDMYDFVKDRFSKKIDIDFLIEAMRLDRYKLVKRLFNDYFPLIKKDRNDAIIEEEAKKMFKRLDHNKSVNGQLIFMMFANIFDDNIFPYEWLQIEDVPF